MASSRRCPLRLPLLVLAVVLLVLGGGPRLVRGQDPRTGAGTPEADHGTGASGDAGTAHGDTAHGDTVHGAAGNGTGHGCGDASGGHGHGTPITTLPIVSWKWEHVKVPYIVTLWILVSWICKLIIEANHNVTNYIPESALLICFGFLLGGVIWGADGVQTFTLTPTVILDAGYTMPNKLFFSNLGAILVYAIIGTCWNAASVGLSLWGCHMGGAMGDLDIGLLQYLLFGSLIAAVDPVAVLAVFEQVHVNEVLFVMVLFNVFDAFVSLGGPRIDAAEIVLFNVFDAFVSLGGPRIDAAEINIQIIEPGFVFVLGYLSYLTAEMLSLSAILAIVFCGIACQRYIKANMDEASVATVQHAMKVFANGSETIIFLFLGISAIDKNIWVWNTGFILLTLLFIIVYRIMGVFFLTWILNKFRLVPLEYIDQIIMSYGGLRGAVAYGLAVLLDETKIKEKNLMVSTTLIGITMKPLVNWLKVKRAATADITLIEKVFDHMLVAIEDISGQIGHNYMRDNAFVDFKKKFDDDLSDVMPDIMANGTGDAAPGSAYARHDIPSVSLEMHDEEDVKGTKEVEGVNSHHLLQQHLYKGRKQHRHRYSRSHFEVNKDEGEVQEIFQRTMRTRLESFKSAKMGVSPANKLSKQHPKKGNVQKMANGKSADNGRSRPYDDEVFDFPESSGASASYGDSFPMTVSYRVGAGVENPAFMPDVESLGPTQQAPPWLTEAEPEGDGGGAAGVGVEPSQRAQLHLPWTPSNLRRLAPLRISTRSTDSFEIAVVPSGHGSTLQEQEQQQEQQQEPPPSPPPPPPPRDTPPPSYEWSRM
ncbi:hypothetical protein CRUP_019090 [Coryphaenoides rupestris]|nr:hypothetical protein CRUP_019090 [Coryphaenoides rupestris]